MVLVKNLQMTVKVEVRMELQVKVKCTVLAVIWLEVCVETTKTLIQRRPREMLRQDSQEEKEYHENGKPLRCCREAEMYPKVHHKKNHKKRRFHVKTSVQVLVVVKVRMKTLVFREESHQWLETLE